jgi:hypothetical protein
LFSLGEISEDVDWCGDDMKNEDKRSVYYYAKPLDFVAIIFLVAWFWEDGADAWISSDFSVQRLIFMVVFYHGILIFLVHVGWYRRKQEAEKETTNDKKSKVGGQ